MNASVYFDNSLSNISKLLEPAISSTGFRITPEPSSADIKIIDSRDIPLVNPDPSTVVVINKSTTDLLKLLSYDDLFHWSYDPSKIEELLLIIEQAYHFEQTRRENFNLKQKIISQHQAYQNLLSTIKFNTSLLHSFDQISELLQIDLMPDKLIARTCDYLSTISHTSACFYRLNTATNLVPVYKTANCPITDMAELTIQKASDLLTITKSANFLKAFGPDWFSGILFSGDKPQGVYLFKEPLDQNLKSPILSMIKFIGLGFDKSQLLLALKKLRENDVETGLYNKEQFLKNFKTFGESKFTWAILEMKPSEHLLYLTDEIKKASSSFVQKLPSVSSYRIADNLIGLLGSAITPADLLMELEDRAEQMGFKAVIGDQNTSFNDLCVNQLEKFKKLKPGTIVFAR